MSETAWIAVQGVSTLLLVGITGAYVYLVRQQTTASAKAAAAAERSAEAAEQSVALLSADARTRRVGVLQELGTIMRVHRESASSWADAAKATAQGEGRLSTPKKLLSEETLSDLKSHAAGVGGEVALNVWHAIEAAGAANDSFAKLCQVKKVVDVSEEELAVEKLGEACTTLGDALEVAARTCDRALSDVHDSLRRAEGLAG